MKNDPWGYKIWIKGRIEYFEFSKCGEKIAYLTKSDNSIYLYDIESKLKRHYTSILQPSLTNLRFSDEESIKGFIVIKNNDIIYFTKKKIFYKLSTRTGEKF